MVNNLPLPLFPSVTTKEWSLNFMDVRTSGGKVKKMCSALPGIVSRKRAVYVLAGAVAALAASGASAETYQKSFDVGGTNRTFTIYVPDGSPAGHRTPTVIALHGSLMTGRTLRPLFDMDRLGDRHGFAIVYPDSLGPRWNDGRDSAAAGQEDARFINLLARYVVNQGIADPRRIYLLGVSSGGMLTYRIACETPETFAAYAVVGAEMPKRVAEVCRRNIGVPMLIVAARRPAAGNDGPPGDLESDGVLPGPETVSFWRRNNGCQNDPQFKRLADRDGREGTAVIAEQYDTCRTHAPLVTLTIENIGAPPPGPVVGNRPLLMSILGRTSNDTLVPDVAWKFFRRFPDEQ